MTLRPGRRRHPHLPVLLLAAALAGCDLPGRPDPADRFVMPDRVLNFAALYDANCRACHGADGQYGPAPPLNDPIFTAIVPLGELEKVIREGRKGTPMPAFGRGHGGQLTEEQVGVLAEGIKTKWAGDPGVEDIPPYAAAGRGDAAAGRQVFARACAGCHGADGTGGKSKDGTSLAIHNAAFLTLMSDQVLRRYIITGRPDLGMPDFASGTGRPDDFRPLTSREIDDVVALLASWRGGGASPGPGE